MIRFQTDYFDQAWQDPQGVIDRAHKDLECVEFDTFVATGVSGSAMLALLAYELGKQWLYVRKEDDRSNHQRLGRAVGSLGERWVFLDDFISSGSTFRRVSRWVQEVAPYVKFMGTYMYAGGRFLTNLETCNRVGGCGAKACPECSSVTVMPAKILLDEVRIDRSALLADYLWRPTRAG